MLMGNCLASMTRLLFLSLWHQEVVTERSGKKIEGIYPGELLPCFNQQVRAPHALSPGTRISSSLQVTVLLYGNSK